MAMNGLEKFSHLEDKIYRTIELAKTLRQEKDDLERELARARGREVDREAALAELDRLMHEREAIRVKVQGILDRIVAMDPDIGEAISG